MQGGTNSSAAQPKVLIKHPLAENQPPMVEPDFDFDDDIPFCSA